MSKMMPRMIMVVEPFFGPPCAIRNRTWPSGCSTLT